MNSVEQEKVVAQRAEELFRAQEESNCAHTDRMFAWLLGLQWLVGAGAALWISPLTWAGRSSQLHIHVIAGFVLGGLIAGFPIFLALRFPGRVFTRHVVAAGQMLASALLIHLLGGRIETHFHVFGSLAFLAFYRDWRVMVTATVVVGLDHFLRGVFWPQSVFGVLSADSWRWLEHVGWVLFEDIFLLLAIRQNVRAMRGLAERQARLEGVNTVIERQVAERTAELREEIVVRKRAEEEVIRAHKDLLESSRMAGMAEIATNVLHNVGNVLNSVNVSAGLVAESLRRSKTTGLGKLAALLQEHEGDMAEFMTKDERGKKVPLYLKQFSEHLEASQAISLKELDSLNANIEHIKDIVIMQQNYARVSGIKEVVNVPDLVEDSLRLNVGALTRHRVAVKRDFAEVPALNLDKHKLLQILINLVRNAKYACDESSRDDKLMTLRVWQAEGRIKISVSDNGIGIPPENLPKIFQHGFTTREGGHGFGLHSSALAAKEMDGTLSVQSDGTEKGATFVLELPLTP